MFVLIARSLISSFFEIFSHYGGIHYIADKLKSFILQLGSDELPQNTENLLEELSSTVSYYRCITANIYR